jgi:hypothetical protein
MGFSRNDSTTEIIDFLCFHKLRHNGVFAFKVSVHISA